MDHVDVTCSDDAELFEAGVGAIIHMKGKLEAVRYGKDADPKSGTWRGQCSGKTTVFGGPSVVVTFADWSMLSAGIDTGDLARAIRIPIGKYVCVKAEVINEDCELRALAIWELGGGAVIPLGAPCCASEA